MKSVAMRTLQVLIGCTLLAVGCQSEIPTANHEQTPAPHPAAPVVSTSHDRSFEVTSETRSNGCTLVLRKYTNSRPSMQGYWVQDAFVDSHHLFSIRHSTSPREQALMFEPMTDIMVLPIDRNLDGKYDMFLLLSPKTNRLIDVLVLADEGCLRLGTREEFEARQKIFENNKKAVEDADNIIQRAIDDAPKDLNQ